MAKIKAMQRRWLTVGLTLVFLMSMTREASFAATYGAITDGNWDSVSTWTRASIPGASDIVYISSNYPAGSAAMATVTLTQNQSANTVNLGYYGGTVGTLDLGNSKLTINDSLYIGQGAMGKVIRENGYFTVPVMSVGYGTTFTFGTLDQVKNQLQIDGNSTVTTTSASNVTKYVSVGGGSKLTLGTDMTLSDGFSIEAGTPTLDMMGHMLSASAIYLESPFALLNRGPLKANWLLIFNQQFDLNASDNVGVGLTLDNATATWVTPISGVELKNSSTATTTVTQNVTDDVAIMSGGKLTLGADMTLRDSMDLRDTGSTLDMAGHALNANGIDFGFFGGAPSLLNNGKISINSLRVGYGSTLPLRPGDLINSTVTLSNASVLEVVQANDQLTGLTFGGNSQSALALDSTSKIDLHFGQSSDSRWIFRWLDRNSSSNWGNALTGMINTGKISITPSNGYYIADKGGYTYIYAVTQPIDFDWRGGDSTGQTNWDVPANWNPGSAAPSGPGVTISFGDQSADNNIVEMGSGKTVGNLIFVAATNTTIQSSDGFDLTLDNNGNLSTIYVTGNHTIATSVILNNDARIEGIGTLNITGGISGPHSLTVLGNLTATSIQVDTLTIGGAGATAVPEPTSLFLLGIGIVSFLAFKWQRRAS